MWHIHSKSKDFLLFYCMYNFPSLPIHKLMQQCLTSLIHSLKGEQEFKYHGDRTRDEIVKFALRLSGPPVQQITRTQSFDTIKRERDLYFLYVGDKSGILWVNFF